MSDTPDPMSSNTKRQRATGSASTVSNGLQFPDDEGIRFSTRTRRPRSNGRRSSSAAHPSSSVSMSSSIGHDADQDARGETLGPVAPTGLEPGQAEEEVKSMHHDITKLEEHFEKMLEAVERNTEGVRRRAEDRVRAMSSGPFEQNDTSAALAEHVWRMGDMLAKNMEHMEHLTKRQLDNEQKLQAALEGVSPTRNASRLSDHLDRIQSMMEHSYTRRDESTPSAAHFSLLINSLQNLQEAIERNSSLMTDVLQSNHTSRDPVPPHLPTQPLIQIHETLEQQNSHLEALLQAQKVSTHAPAQDLDLTPLAAHLEAVRESIDRIPRSLSFGPLAAHLEGIRDATASTATAAAKTESVLSALGPQMSRIQSATEQTSTAIQTLAAAASQHASPSSPSSSAKPQPQPQHHHDNDAESALQKRLEATNAQVRDLMAGQREMNAVMRELAQAIMAQSANRESCGHIVIPPPRKMRRKVVGFVYDAKGAMG